MTDLAGLSEGDGLPCVRTYIATGNAVFMNPEKKAAVRDALERVLAGRYPAILRKGIAAREASSSAAVRTSTGIK